MGTQGGLHERTGDPCVSRTRQTDPHRHDRSDQKTHGGGRIRRRERGAFENGGRLLPACGRHGFCVSARAGRDHGKAVGDRRARRTRARGGNEAVSASRPARPVPAGVLPENRPDPGPARVRDQTVPFGAGAVSSVGLRSGGRRRALRTGGRCGQRAGGVPRRKARGVHRLSRRRQRRHARGSAGIPQARHRLRFGDRAAQPGAVKGLDAVRTDLHDEQRLAQAAGKPRHGRRQQPASPRR